VISSSKHAVLEHDTEDPALKGNAVKHFCGQQTRSVEVAELARVQTNNHRRRNSCEFRYKNASQRCLKGLQSICFVNLETTGASILALPPHTNFGFKTSSIDARVENPCYAGAQL
jgi:hypothetical protein